MGTSVDIDNIYLNASSILKFYFSLQRVMLTDRLTNPIVPTPPSLLFIQAATNRRDIPTPERNQIVITPDDTVVEACDRILQTALKELFYSADQLGFGDMHKEFKASPSWTKTWRLAVNLVTAGVHDDAD